MSPNFEILISLEFLFMDLLGLGLGLGLRKGLELGVMVVRMVWNLFHEPIKREIKLGDITGFSGTSKIKASFTYICKN